MRCDRVTADSKSQVVPRKVESKVVRLPGSSVTVRATLSAWVFFVKSVPLSEKIS